MKICLIAETYGTCFPNHGACGPSIVAFNLAKALRYYSDLDFEMYIIGFVDPLCAMPNVFQIHPKDIDTVFTKEFFSKFNLFHVINGFPPALLITGQFLNEKTLLGTNVIFNTDPQRKTQLYATYSCKQTMDCELILAVEEYICSHKWKKILITSSGFTEEFRKRFRCSEEDIKVLWTGIDTNLFKPNDNIHKRYITWAAKDPRQNVHIISRIAEAFPEEEFLACGLDGKYNYFDHSKTLQRSKLFISTFDETQGIAILEAMACGVPVIVRQQHLYSEHNVNAIKISSSDLQPNVKAYIEAIKELLTNHELRAKIAQGGCEYVRRNYSLEQMAKLYINILNDY
jgi:glycosyltransferase involved in cell wall biosynthesis